MPPTGRRSIASIYLIVLFDQRTDGIGLSSRVGGDKLGDNIDAVVVALAR